MLHVCLLVLLTSPAEFLTCLLCLFYPLRAFLCRLLKQWAVPLCAFGPICFCCTSSWNCYACILRDRHVIWFVVSLSWNVHGDTESPVWQCVVT